MGARTRHTTAACTPAAAHAGQRRPHHLIQVHLVGAALAAHAVRALDQRVRRLEELGVELTRVAQAPADLSDVHTLVQLDGQAFAGHVWSDHPLEQIHELDHQLVHGLERGARDVIHTPLALTLHDQHRIAAQRMRWREGMWCDHAAASKARCTARALAGPTTTAWALQRLTHQWAISVRSGSNPARTCGATCRTFLCSFAWQLVGVGQYLSPQYGIWKSSARGRLRMRSLMVFSA